MECDSKHLVDWILNNSDPPWNLWDTVIKIINQLNQLDIWRIQHCFKEGNRVADSLANWGRKCKELTWIIDSQQLPKEAKGEH